MTMDRMEAVRLALAEIGDVTAAELVMFVKDRYGVNVEPRIIPVIKATLRDKERMDAARRKRSSETVVAVADDPSTSAR